VPGCGTKPADRPARLCHSPAPGGDAAARKTFTCLVQIPRYEFRILGRRHLLDVVDRATQRRMTLVCAPAGAGKSVACAAWAAARGPRHVVWVTLESENDQRWFWAHVYSVLKQTSAIPEETAQLLEDEPFPAFPLRLVGVACGFREPVMIVVDNVDFVTDSDLLDGLELIARHAPPSLRLVLCARRPPAMRLDRLRASGDLAEISGADLAAARLGAHPGRPAGTRNPDRALGRLRTA
jgi:LuxR family transcriptional regulator, maltose regulon positive regulatory protein